MTGAFFDIEDFSNYLAFLFLDINTKQEYIDMYIEADINDDVQAKKDALSHMEYKHFVFCEDRWDAVEFYAFMKGIKLLIGFNSIKFDNLLLDYMFIYKDIIMTKNIGRVTQRFKMLANDIVSNNNLNYRWLDDDLKNFKEWWTSIDLLLALFETVARKSLKQAGINIKWYRIEDLPLKPDAFVKREDYPKIEDYHFNDVFITRALYIKKKGEFELRVNISNKYGVNVLTSNRSSIADKLMIKFYSEYTGQKYYQFKDKRTIRTSINFGELLNPKIRFNNPILRKVHEEMLNTTYYVGKDYIKDIIFKDKGYTIAKGGLHSKDRPGKFEADAVNIFLRDADVSSYYPRLVYNEGACPAHIAPVAFSSIVLMVMTDRLKYKSNIKIFKKQGLERDMIDAKTGAETLKIVANSGVYGKMGYDGWLFDLKAMYQVTLNGQLYLMMMIEQLEEAGIEIISANTDGILARFNKSKLDEYNKITKDWQTYVKLELEFADYIKYVRTSVNDYIAIKKEWLTSPDDEDTIKRKGDFLTEVELSKGFNAPIVAIALDKLNLYGTPIEETICNHIDIYDYCISVKTGDVFDKQLHSARNGSFSIDSLSKNLRYFVSTDGGTLLKHKKDDKGDHYSNMVKGVLITPFNDYFRVNSMSEYNINYQYYIKRATDILLKIGGVYDKPRTSRVYRGKGRKGVSQCGSLFDNI